MQLTLQVPDELERRAPVVFALEEFRAGRINETQIRKIPGLARISGGWFSQVPCRL
jgi:DNA-directed RNA polymerase subunit K/omega